MNYYERYCGDYARDTALLSLAEHGAYTLMLDVYYSTETPLPADIGILCRMCRATTKIEQAAVKTVAEQFFEVGEDGLRHNRRADRDVDKAQKRIGANRSNGTKGGRPKKNPPGFDDGEKENPPGSESGQKSEPKHNPPETHAGEASPHATRHTPKVKTLAAAPLGVRQEVWEKWARFKGKKLTPDAVELQTKRLCEFAAQGDDPNAVIEQSIANGYAGLFPLSRAAQRDPTQAQKRTKVAQAIFGDRKDDDAIDGTAERIA